MISNTNLNGNWHEREVGSQVLQKKYLHENEDFNGMIERVTEVSGVPAMKDYLRNADFFLAGRSLYGAGLKDVKKVTTSNCFVLKTPEDTLDSIYNTCKDAAIIGSLGGGVGVAVDNIRPKGSTINNSAKESSGVEFVMNLLNETGQNIGQQGRHMAIMVMLDCNHPDIIEFLGIKQRNNRLDSMNISIKFTDKFMEAVRDNKEYTLQFDVKSTGEHIERKINAKDFFMKFCECQYDWGDPGGCFIDRVRDYQLLSGYDDYTIDCSNPCFTGDMRLLTADGYKAFTELEGKETYVVSYDGSISIGKIWCSGEKDTVKVRLSSGKTITCTPNHVFMTVDKSEVEAKNTKGLQLMPYIDSSDRSCEMFFEKLGFIQGDGQLTRLKSESHKGLEVNIGDKDSDILDLFEQTQADMLSSGRVIYVSGYNDALKSLGFSPEPLPQREFPTSYDKTWADEEKTSFLRGCYSANGCVMNGKSDFRIQYKTTCKKFAEQMVATLSGFGINSYITTNKPKNVKFTNGDYVCKESYDINIAQYESKREFYNTIGFIQKYKDILLLELLIKHAPRVTSIKPNGIHKVYDFSEPNNHWGVVEGNIVHNCAEFFGNSGNSCNLASINLYNLVDKPFTDTAEINFDKLEKVTMDGIIALNNILSYGESMLPLESNKECVRDYRSIGLGIFGLADMLIAMGLRYGSDEANLCINGIMYSILRRAIITSNQLASRDGTFDKYSWKNTKKSPLIKMFEETTIYDNVKKHGLRNGTLLSIAPSGSISTMAGISNGCEPLFMISYERTTHSLEKQGKYFKVYAKSVEDLLKHHGIDPESITVDEIKKRFPFVVDSHDITPEERVRTQAVMQKYVDNAISSTVNLKESATVQDIFDTYMLAWEQGLKGITVFRAGCKRGSILGGSGANATEESKRFNSISPVKRNNIRKMDGSTFVGHTACVKNLYTTVNKMDDDVFEVFTNVSTGCKSNINTITRLVSLALRSRIKVSEVIHELKANTCPACTVLKGQGKNISSSCGNAIAEAIEEAYGTTEVDETLAICPECGKRGLVPTGKCVSCTQCGYSRCD